LTVKNMIEGLGSGFSISLGCVLLIYGLFRFYRAYLDLKEIARKQ